MSKTIRVRYMDKQNYLEGHVFQEVSHAVGLGSLVAATSINPNANSGGLRIISGSLAGNSESVG